MKVGQLNYSIHLLEIMVIHSDSQLYILVISFLYRCFYIRLKSFWLK